MRIILSALLFTTFIINPVFAASHSSLQPLPATEFNALVAAAGKINLGAEAYRGVLARAELSPLPEEEEGMPVAKHYLLSVSFMSEKSRSPLQTGDVAVKITAPDGTISDPVRLNPESGMFQAEITLSSEGESLIRIGSKLPDEKKRIYRFFYTDPQMVSPAAETQQ